MARNQSVNNALTDSTLKNRLSRNEQYQHVRPKGLQKMGGTMQKRENAFRLPDGNVAIAFSGGRTSAMMLHEILRANGDLPERVVVSFQNTGREMPETLDFVHECGDRWGVRIVWLEYRPAKPLFEVVSHNSASRDGEPFEALIRRKRALPNQNQRWCTQEMKVLTERRYLMSIGWREWTKARGIRADEIHRAKESTDFRTVNWHPLCDAGTTKDDVSTFWARQAFGLRLPEVETTNPGGNCDMCFLKSEERKAYIARHYPERAAWWAEQERRVGKTFRDRYPVKDMQRLVEQGDWIFDARGYLCGADDGECTG